LKILQKAFLAVSSSCVSENCYFLPFPSSFLVHDAAGQSSGRACHRNPYKKATG